jgi:PAS domain S-box-containing protein
MKGRKEKEREAGGWIPALLEALPDLIFRVEEGGVIVEILSGEDPTRFGLADRQLADKKVEELFPQTISRQILDAHHTALEQGELFVTRYRMNGGKEEHCFEVRIRPELAGGEGNRRTSIVVIRDITNTKRSEDYLRLIEKIFEDATEAILILSSKRNHAQFNEAFCRMFGIECFEKLGNSLEDYARFFDGETFTIIRETVRRNGGFHGEVVIHRPDGSTLSAWLSVDNVYDKDEEEVFQVAMLTDISELQESREMLRFTSTHDALTGLPNRRMLLNHIEQAVLRSVRHRHSGAVFFIDLDNFKDINDTMRHIAREAVLIECAARIRSVIR